MNSRSSRRALLGTIKALCLFSSFLLVCPFFQASNAILGPQPADILWIQVGCGAIAGFFGTGMGYLFHRAVRRHPVLCRSVQIILCPLAGILCFVLLRGILPFWETVVAAAVGIFVYFMGLIFSDRPYDRILSQPLLFRFTMIQVGVIALTAWQKWPIELSVSVFIALFVLLNFFVMSNQSNLETLMERGSHGLEYLPRRIRSFNLGLVVGLYVLLAALYLFRDPIGTVLSRLGDLLLAAARAVYQFLAMLFSGFADTPADPAADPLPQNDMQFIPQNDYSDIINLILWIFFIALLVVVVWYYRRQILDALRELFGALADHLYRLFHPSGRQVQTERESVDYIDEITELPRGRKNLRTRDGRSLRRWKLAYRRYRKMPDGPEKYREGYRLILLWLSLKKKPQEKSRTPREIFTATSQEIPSPAYRQTTDGYEEIRYGEEPVSAQEMAALSETLRNLAE